MLSKNSLRRGLAPKGPLPIEDCKEFSEKTGGMKFMLAKRSKQKGLAVGGLVLAAISSWKDGQDKSKSDPFQITYKFLITKAFAPTDVGDPSVCRVADAKTAYLTLLWAEYFAYDNTVATEYRKTHNLDVRRTYKDPVSIGEISIRPFMILDVVFAVQAPSSTEPVEYLTTSNGRVGVGSWIQFTNVHTNCRVKAGKIQIQATAAIDHCPTEFERNWSIVGNFGTILNPFPRLPDTKIVPTTPEQEKLLQDIQAHIAIDKGPKSTYWIDAYAGLEAQLFLPEEDVESLKSLVVFNPAPDADYVALIEKYGIKIEPWSVEVGYLAKGKYCTMTATVNVMSTDAEGKGRSLSYLLQFFGASDIALKKMGLSTVPGLKLVERMINAARENVTVYGNINLPATLKAPILTGKNGTAVTDGTVIVEVVDFEIDMVAAIRKCGIPLTIEHVNYLLTNDIWNTMTLRSPTNDRSYQYDESKGFINLTESLLPASDAEFEYYLVYSNMSEIEITRFHIACESKFNGDVAAASKSVMKYLLGQPGADQFWANEVSRIMFRSPADKIDFAPMIFGLNKNYLNNVYKPRPKMTLPQREEMMTNWLRDMMDFYSIQTEQVLSPEELQQMEEKQKQQEQEKALAAKQEEKKRKSDAKNSKAKKPKKATVDEE